MPNASSGFGVGWSGRSSFGKAWQRPCRGQRFLGHLRRAVRTAPAHEAGLVLPEVVRPGKHPAVFHPDDLLVHESARLLPASLQHRLAARGVPAVPGSIFGDGLGDRRSYEAVVKLRALRTVVPGCAIGRGPIPCCGSDGSSRRSRRDTADRSRTGSRARHSSGSARRQRWCCHRRAAGGRRGSTDRWCANAGFRGGSGMVTGGTEPPAPPSSPSPSGT